jgi:hypothetical protein
MRSFRACSWTRRTDSPDYAMTQGSYVLLLRFFFILRVVSFQKEAETQFLAVPAAESTPGIAGHVAYTR